MSSLGDDFDAADSLVEAFPQKASVLFEALLKKKIDYNQEEDVKIFELSYARLGEVYSKLSKREQLSVLIKSVRPFLCFLSRARSAKLLRNLVDDYLRIPGFHIGKESISLCEECIEWTISEKRNFLRQALETRLIGIYVDSKEYSKGLLLCAKLSKELKKLDDKALLVEVQLLESRAYYLLRNTPKSRASLTSARTSANAIYCPPALQANLDLMAGILHAEEKDFKTSFSYFYEAFEAFDSVDNSKMALASLKYMILSKTMLGLSDDVYSIISGKLALRYSGPELEAMQGIAKAHHDRSLEEFEKCIKTHHVELNEDPIIHSHLKALKEALLEENLCRLVEPFSRVEIPHIAKLIRLDVAVVEKKLSEMILDKRFFGILDQGAGCLVVFNDAPSDKTYEAALSTIQNVGHVVDSLYLKAQKLS
eukprot:Sdes_comp18671_c0_seq1m8916